jgi:hypothetical protein
MYVHMLRNWLGLLYCRRRDKGKQLHVFVEISLYLNLPKCLWRSFFWICLKTPTRDECNRSVGTNMSVTTVVSALRIEVIRIFPLRNAFLRTYVLNTKLSDTRLCLIWDSSVSDFFPILVTCT